MDLESIIKESEYLNILLEETEKIDDLEILEEIEQKLLMEEQNAAQDIDKIVHRNLELKEKLDKAKFLNSGLDQQHNEELEKCRNLRESIQLKELQLLQEQEQQVNDLEQFEVDVAEITEKFVSAYEEHASNYLTDKINFEKRLLEENKIELQQKIEERNKVQTEFEKPVETESMDLALQVIAAANDELETYNKTLAQKLDKMMNEVKSLRFDKMTAKITKKVQNNKI